MYSKPHTTLLSSLLFSFQAMIAQSKASGSKTDFNDDSALTRLFVICPKEYTEDDLRSKFEAFGEIEYTQVVRDHKTKEPKGFGYVKFSKTSSAALALENCDKSLKAVWAEPKSAKVARNAAAAAAALTSTLVNVPHNPYLESGYHAGATTSVQQQQTQSMGFDFFSNSASSTPSISESITTSHTPTRLFVIVSMSVTQEQLGRLFDIIPGMQLCDLKKNYNTGESKGFAYVTYNSVGSAIYAKEKLNGFEYPPGTKLVVKYAEDPPGNRNSNGAGAQVESFTAQMYGSRSSLPSYGVEGSSVYTSAALPPPAPFSDPNAEVACRLFIVCQPGPPPEQVLRDVFSRFGNMIDVWMMKDRNFGYAKYASKESAEAAIVGLNGHSVLGMKLKVMQADPPKSEASRKRPRT